MRYHSLWLLSAVLKSAALVGVILVMIFFIVFLIGSIQTVTAAAAAVEQTASIGAYLTAATPPILFLFGGLFGCLVTFAAGALVMLLVSIEANVSSIENRLAAGEPYNRSLHGSWDTSPQPKTRSPRVN